MRRTKAASPAAGGWSSRSPLPPIRASRRGKTMKRSPGPSRSSTRWRRHCSPRVQADGRTFSYLLHQGEQEIRIVQNDVRAIQLGKAALYAGIRLLMDRLGIEQVEQIMLAGAFGSHIDTKYAMLLGMIPDCPLEHVHSAGNAAGTGARIALLNQLARDEIEDVIRRVEKIETAVEPKFQSHFVEAMAIPHATAGFPNLEQRSEEHTSELQSLMRISYPVF